MSQIQESSVWVDSIYQLSTETPVLGKAENSNDGGPSNLQAEQLANRTRFLYDLLIILQAAAYAASKMAESIPDGLNITSEGEFFKVPNNTKETVSFDVYMNLGNGNYKYITNELSGDAIAAFQLMGLIGNDLPDESGYSFVLRDKISKRIGFGLKTNGEVIAPLLSIARDQISSELEVLLPVALPASSGYVWGLRDKNTQKYALRVAVNGSIDAPLLIIGKGVITVDNLSESLKSAFLPFSQDVVDVMPSAIRSSVADITTRTNDKDGSAWSQLAPHICRSLYGINNTGVTIEYRPSFGLKIAGKAKGNAFSPGPVHSTSRRGRLTSPVISTPTGTFVAGDYYSYEAYNTNSGVSETTPGVWEGQNVYLGDLLVYDGSGWIIQRSPGSGAARKPDTWYDVTTDGVFAGMSLKTGDKLLFLTLQTAGGGFLQPQYASVNAGSDLFFYGGEFTPANGLPESNLKNVIYQAAAAGTVGTDNYLAGDYAIYDGTAWVHISNSASVSVVAGQSISIRCTGNADEWEFRRADKISTAVGIRLNAQVESIMKTGLGKKLLLIGDSMLGSGSSGSTILAATGRTGEVRSYGGSTSDQVLGMLKQEIMSWGDRWAGQVIVACHGQNNQPKTDANASQIREASLQMAALAGARDIRCLFLTIMGQRESIWSDGRLVFPQHENQFAKTGYLYELTEWYGRIMPGRFAVMYDIMLSAATDSVDPTFPELTEKEVAENYGVLPWSFFNNSVLPGGLLTSDIRYMGAWNTAGLPTGGSHKDYYLRTGAGTVGNLLVNNDGTWSEVSIDITHMSQAGGRALAFGGDGVGAIPASDGVVGILSNNLFFK